MLIVLLLLLLCPIRAEANYYAKINTYSEAISIANNSDANLISYSNKIAVYDTLPTFDDLVASNYIFVEDHVARLCRTPYNGTQKSYLEEINYLNTYQHGITGKGVQIAIIDTGCDVNHRELKHAICGAYNIRDGTSDVTDVDGHGTHVAGIIAAKDDKRDVVGIAPDAKLYIIKANHDDSEFFLYSDIIRSIYRCIDLGNIDIMNLSFAGTDDDIYLHIAILDAMNEGILPVMAAGNYGSYAPYYPASYQVGLSVGACYDHRVLSFSNKGDNVNIYAPGLAIYSTAKGNSFTSESGTSCSAPIVAATAALYMSKYKVHNPYIVKSIILQSLTDGYLDIQKIFELEKIKAPTKPIVTITEDNILQKKLTIKSDNDTTLFYTLDNEIPTQYSKQIKNNKIIFDKAGTYNLRISAVKNNTNAYSATVDVTVEVKKGVYSRDFLKSLDIVGEDVLSINSTELLTLKSNNSNRKIKNKLAKWKSSNPKVVSVKDGKIKGLKKGKATITAKVGGYTKKIKITVKK